MKGQKSSNRSSVAGCAAAASVERWGVLSLLDPAGGSVLSNTPTHTHTDRERVSGLMKLVYRSFPVATGSVSCGP